MSLIEQRLPQLPLEQEKLNEEVQVDWRDILKTALCANESEINTQRKWSTFTQRLRELCPETEWLFIREDGYTSKEAKMISEIQSWMEALIVSLEWPFPERVIISAHSSGKERIYKISFSQKIGTLPYTPAPSTITVTPWKDEHSIGWKIRFLNSYSVHKAGEA